MLDKESYLALQKSLYHPCYLIMVVVVVVIVVMIMVVVVVSGWL